MLKVIVFFLSVTLLLLVLEIFGIPNSMRLKAGVSFWLIVFSAMRRPPLLNLTVPRDDSLLFWKTFEEILLSSVNSCTSMSMIEYTVLSEKSLPYIVILKTFVSSSSFTEIQRQVSQSFFHVPSVILMLNDDKVV